MWARLISLLVLTLAVISTAHAINIETKLGKEVAANLDRVMWHGAHDITIEDRHGFIILTGTVASEADRNSVVTATRAVPGVRDLKDNLSVVALGGKDIRSQSELIEQIRVAVSKSYELSGPYKFEIAAHEGIVTLTGQAASSADAHRIGAIASRVAGVVKVENMIQPQTPPQNDELKTRIKRALESEPSVKLEGIDFKVEHGVVTFTGAVTDHRQIDKILSRTLMIDGVRDVRSQVIIKGRK